ncbi:hypothetical protein Q5P01_018188 [Channa striata]|uniref:Granulins domain-containing protein n=1 Tax=Channa striata TaxID=64152 RepID=A0AA88S9H7_CHASR|nr:hypothetical protein Q5P01_018188 [Channa striata]
MLGLTLWLLFGVFMKEFASGSNACPDGSVCPDSTTCCSTESGYSCCHYPNAVCCSDQAHCCPSGFRCNIATQTCERTNEPWMNIPMVKNEVAEEPSIPVLPVSPLQELKPNHVPDLKKSSVVHCDNLYVCPDGTTCCRHPRGVWFCCPYSLGRCCLDGIHCCPFGFDCDLTYTHCVRDGLRFPFIPKPTLSSVPATLISSLDDEVVRKETPMTALTEASSSIPEAGVIRCDSSFYCSKGTCCKGTAGQWNCCPYPLGQCCADGRHCCEYGYTCDPSSSSCRKWYSKVPSGAQEHAKLD